LLDALHLRTLPVPDPQRLVMLQLADTTGKRGSQATQYPALTNPLWERLRDTQDAFSGVLAWGGNSFGLGAGGEIRSARGLFVSGDFFRVLGVRPVAGRVFSAADDRRGCGLPGAVISYAFWQREFGGEISALGRKLTLNYQPVEVVGVAPAAFTGLEVGRAFDVAVPICAQAALWSGGNWLDAGTVWWLMVLGRLKPGGTLQQANAQLRATSPALFRSTLPANYPPANVKDFLKFKLAAVQAGNGVSGLRMQYEDPLLLLLATACLVLLIACANLANLLLARATAREHELAVCLAIGASRGRLIRQSMVESAILAVGGAIAGLLLSGALSRFLVSLLETQGDPLFLDLHADVRVFGFTAGIAALTCMLFGLAPALRVTRSGPGDAMRSGGRAVSAVRERFGPRQILVISQVAFSLVLVFGALLFTGSLRNLLGVNAGFQQSGILVVNLDYRRLNIPPVRHLEFERGLLAQIRALPGVTSAASIDILPLSGGGIDNSVWRETDPGHKVDANFNWCGAGYFHTMGIPTLAGRDFNSHDTPTAPRVAVVNESFARRLGLGADPVGKRFRREATPSQPEQVFEIAGLVRDTKYFTLREEFKPIAFLDLDQETDTTPSAQFVVHASIGLHEVTTAVRGVLRQASPEITVDFRAFDESVRDGLRRERLMAILSGFFGALAALIAALGLYGVMSYLVARRTGEIGVRIALGADRADITGLIMRQAGTLLAIGIAAGAAMALVLAQAVQSMLFGLKPRDGGMLAMAAALLAAVTAVSAYLPARRAARLEPMRALRWQ
jgi:putative ABC transport system permease protein